MKVPIQKKQDSEGGVCEYTFILWNYVLVNVFTDILYREQEMKCKNFFKSTLFGKCVSKFFIY